MEEMKTTRGGRSKTYRRALQLHQLGLDAHGVMVSYAYVHVVLFTLFYADALTLGALILSDSMLAASVLLSLGIRFVSALYAERMLRRWMEEEQG